MAGTPPRVIVTVSDLSAFPWAISHRAASHEDSPLAYAFALIVDDGGAVTYAGDLDVVFHLTSVV
jgi:hypothetical protein